MLHSGKGSVGVRMNRDEYLGDSHRPAYPTIFNGGYLGVPSVDNSALLVIQRA